MRKFILKSKTATEAIYFYKNDYQEVHIFFNLSNKTIDFDSCYFIKTSEADWTPQMSDWEKHNASMGYWQSDTIFTLGVEELDFIYEKRKELFK